MLQGTQHLWRLTMCAEQESCKAASRLAKGKHMRSRSHGGSLPPRSQLEVCLP